MNLRNLGNLKSQRVLTVLGVSLALLSACSGRNIHPDLHENKQILVREWTNSTRDISHEGVRGTEYSNPVFYENTLIFGNRSKGLMSIYPLSNLRRWEVSIRGGVVSELAVDRSSVYFGGGDGFIYSVDAETGKIQWKYEVRNPHVSQPTVSAGRLFLTTSDDVVYALDAGTGKWLWHYRRRTSASSAVTLNAAKPWVNENEVMVGLSDGYLVGLSVEDGQLKWQKKIHEGSKFTDVDASPVLSDDVLFIPSYDGSLYCLKRSKPHEIIWRFDAGGSKDVVLENGENGRIFMPSSDGMVYALKKSNSKVLWKFELDHGTPTKLVVTDRYVIVGSSYQYLYVLDKETGMGLYRYNVGHDSGFSGSPAYDDKHKRVYFLSSGGNLMSFSIREPLRQRTHGRTDGYL